MRTLVAVVTLAACIAGAQTPKKIAYQGQLLRSDGTPETGTVQMTFSVFDSETQGTALWTETQTIALAQGFYATYLGEATALPDTVFTGPERFLEVSVNGSALTPRMRLVSVPYALYASGATTAVTANTANTAQNVSGGVVDATSIRIGGQEVISDGGVLVGSAAAALGYDAGVGIFISGQTLSLRTTCAGGEVLRWNGTDWLCSTAGSSSYDADPDGGLVLVGASGTSFSLLRSCSGGQLLKWNGASSTWACANDTDTTYTAGSGIRFTGTTVAIDSTGCSSGQVLKWNGTNAWQCQADTNTSYSAGAGLALSGTTFSLSSAGCASGEVWKYDGTTWSCEPDADTTYVAGAGLALAGNTFSLSSTGCANGQLLKWNGSIWQCQNDADTVYSAGNGLSLSGTTFALASTGCASGQVLKWSGTAWQCQDDIDTNAGGDIQGVTAGTGLAGGGSTGTVTLSVDTAFIQSRVTGACPAGSSISAVNQNGTVSCELDDNNVYTASGALALVGSDFRLSTTGCVAGEVWKYNGSTWSCEPDDNAGG